MNRIIAYRTPFKVLPVVDEFLRAMAPYEPPARADEVSQYPPGIAGQELFNTRWNRTNLSTIFLRDTIALTMLGGSQQTNVIPPEAWANLDVRLLPGDDPKEFLAPIRAW